MFYLDTSVIRPMIKVIEETDLKNSVCTSVLTLVELVTGSKDNEDLRRRVNLASRLVESKMLIHYEPAENYLIRAFKILKPLADWESKIREVISSLQDVLRVEDVSAAVATKNLTDFWSFLDMYDKITSRSFGDEFFRAVSVAKRSSSGIAPDWKDIKSNVESWASSFALDGEINRDQHSKAKLINEFRMEYPCYLWAGNYYLNLVLDGRTPGRNDYFDLQHFAYINDPHQILVTSDKLMLQIGSEIAPKNIRNAKEVLKEFGME